MIYLIIQALRETLQRSNTEYVCDHTLEV